MLTSFVGPLGHASNGSETQTAGGKAEGYYPMVEHGVGKQSTTFP